MPAELLLKNKTALVTGGGSGFGEGISKLFAQEGAHVVILDLHEGNAKKVADEIIKSGGRADVQVGDVTKVQTWQRTLAFCKTIGGLDIVINNAGWSYALKDSLTVTEAEFDRMFNINVKSIFHSVNIIMPHFLERGGGSMVNIGSCIVSRPGPGLLWYGASKGAVDMITRSLSTEFAPRGVRVNGILPSIAETPLFEAFLGQTATPELRQARIAEAPLGRLCTPMDIAKGCLYFCAPYFNDFTTGVLLRVDGGNYC